MTETQLLDIIKHARQNFWETQQKFSKRAEILELTANTTSLSLNDFGKARELIARGVEITKDYFVACEAIIFSLDDAARPMLAQLSTQTVGQIADLLKEITEDMDGTTTTFNVSLNGRSLGSSDLMPKPGILAKSAQMFWSRHFETMPGYAEELARRKAEKSQKEKALKQAKEQAADAVRKAKTQLEQKHHSNAAGRTQLKERCDDALAKFREDAMRYLEQAPAPFREEKLEALTRSYSDALDTYLNQAFNHQTVTDTVQTQRSDVKPSDVLMDDLQKEVYFVLQYSDRWLGITEIAQAGNIQSSNQKINTALQQLVDVGLIVKMEHSYATAGTPYTVKAIIWKENAANAKKPFPAPPALDFELPQAAPAVALQPEKRSKKPLVMACIAACVALLVGVILFITLSGNNRKTEAWELAQSHITDLYAKTLETSDYLAQNGVTQITATVEDVLLIRSKDLLITTQPHYLVVVRLDCQVDGKPTATTRELVNHIGRYLPDTIGEVDGYPVKCRAEIMNPSSKLLGKEASYYDLSVMVNIYINGRLEGTPNSYR